VAVVLGCAGGAATASAPEQVDQGDEVQAPVLNLARLLNYSRPEWPAHYDAVLQGQPNAPADNPVTDAGATLGRVLFFDRRLSINNRVSCASCHRRDAAFSDVERFSVGFSGTRRTAVHSMRLANIRFFAPRVTLWSRRGGTVEAQATLPIRDSVEMGFDEPHGGFDAAVTRMRGLPYYAELFTLAFGDADITEMRVQRALAQFMRAIVSLDSRFDREFARVFSPERADRGAALPFAGFSAEENCGKQLFVLSREQGGVECAECHAVPTFALAATARSNGLDAGEHRVFKAPSLKSVAVTGPYMHDGRFDTQEQVVAHYDAGSQDAPALDQRLHDEGGRPVRLQVSAADRAALVAFLRTLTDSTLARDERFSDPFPRNAP